MQVALSSLIAFASPGWSMQCIPQAGYAWRHFTHLPRPLYALGGNFFEPITDPGTCLLYYCCETELFSHGVSFTH
jgi:hypothetical protein